VAETTASYVLTYISCRDFLYLSGNVGLWASCWNIKTFAALCLLRIKGKRFVIPRKRLSQHRYRVHLTYMGSGARGLDECLFWESLAYSKVIWGLNRRGASDVQIGSSRRMLLSTLLQSYHSFPFHHASCEEALFWKPLQEQRDMCCLRQSLSLYCSSMRLKSWYVSSVCYGSSGSRSSMSCGSRRGRGITCIARVYYPNSSSDPSYMHPLPCRLVGDVS
jgi:hypothetical protein